MPTTTTAITNDQTRLYAHVILDRSGSMAACAGDAIGGYSTYVTKLPANARVSLTLFDSGGIDLVRDAVPPPDAILKPGEYEPRASTPLYDAIGQTVAQAEERSKGFDRVALVILTDGFENASRKFEREAILELLREKREKDGWLVIYLGANQDAWEVGRSIGVADINSLSFGVDVISDVLDSAARATRSYVSANDRRLGQDLSGFSSEERGRAVGRRRSN
jgi:hypothetical protein